MDGKRFDEFARWMSAGTNRRKALKAVFATTGAFLFGTPFRNMSAQTCVEVGESCAGHVCCPDLRCQLETFRCVPLDTYCGLPGATCEVDSDCCSSLQCDQSSHICTTGQNNSGCTTNDECKGDLICSDEGTCITPPPSGCTGDGDCDPGECCCEGGSCSAECCAAEPSPTPTAGQPVQPPTDNSSGNAPTTLPSTGSGPRTDQNHMTGLLGAAGAATASLAFILRNKTNKITKQEKE